MRSFDGRISCITPLAGSYVLDRIPYRFRKKCEDKKPWAGQKRGTSQQFGAVKTRYSKKLAASVKKLAKLDAYRNLTS
jgi:hypothetical protein